MLCFLWGACALCTAGAFEPPCGPGSLGVSQSCLGFVVDAAVIEHLERELTHLRTVVSQQPMATLPPKPYRPQRHLPSKLQMACSLTTNHDFPAGLRFPSSLGFSSGGVREGERISVATGSMWSLCKPGCTHPVTRGGAALRWTWKRLLERREAFWRRARLHSSQKGRQLWCHLPLALCCSGARHWSQPQQLRVCSHNASFVHGFQQPGGFLERGRAAGDGILRLHTAQPGECGRNNEVLLFQDSFHRLAAPLTVATLQLVVQFCF